MIDEIDVWHTGTEEELSELLGKAMDSPLEGHPGMKCVGACREEEGPIATAEKHDRLDEKGQPVLNPMTGKPHQDAGTKPGRVRLRLSYRTG